jgi:uncharacterized protein GlcG (DUF336 family)
MIAGVAVAVNTDDASIARGSAISDDLYATLCEARGRGWIVRDQRGGSMIGCRQAKQDLEQQGGFSRVALDLGRRTHTWPPIGKSGADRARAVSDPMESETRSTFLLCRNFATRSGIRFAANCSNRCQYLAVRLLRCFLVLLLGSQTSLAQNATYTVKLLTPDAAREVAVAALEACRKQGYQVAVAVADRGGVTQVLLRDRFAGPHTVETAMNKAWTAVSLRQDTLAFDIATAGEDRAAGVRILPRIVAVGGGVLIEASGALLGAIGVSGAPGAEADDHCAKAGLAAIRDELELEP